MLPSTPCLVAQEPELITQDSSGNGSEVVQTYVSATELDVNRFTTGAITGRIAISPAPAGQYEAGDRVQVLVDSRWMDGEAKGQNLNLYDVRVPGYRGDFDSDMVSAMPENIRISNTPPAASIGQACRGTGPQSRDDQLRQQVRRTLGTNPALERVVFRGG